MVSKFEVRSRLLCDWYILVVIFEFYCNGLRILIMCTIFGVDIRFIVVLMDWVVDYFLIDFMLDSMMMEFICFMFWDR